MWPVICTWSLRLCLLEHKARLSKTSLMRAQSQPRLKVGRLTHRTSIPRDRTTERQTSPTRLFDQTRRQSTFEGLLSCCRTCHLRLTTTQREVPPNSEVEADEAL